MSNAFTPLQPIEKSFYNSAKAFDISHFCVKS